jgi:hypothetical protein
MGAAAAALTSAAEKAQGDRCELDGTLFFGMLSFGEYTKHSCRKLTFRSDYGLIATGVIAAISSVAFAIFMISEGSNPEMVKKGEIARFFTRGLLAKSDKSPGSVNKPDTQSWLGKSEQPG